MHITVNNRKLRCGYTTGTCAAAATKASLYKLITGRELKEVKIETPMGIILDIEVVTYGENSAGVIKDAGDDPDSTDKVLVISRVDFNDSGKITIDGGIGVGRVTKPGLDQKVGNAAINSVPRKMIRDVAENLLSEFDEERGVDITIEVPEGEKVAKKTFNSRIGVIGGISILGTSGIVIPMSKEALIATIDIDVKQKIEQGNKHLYIAPGNYGKDFSKKNFNIEPDDIVMSSNYVGETLDLATYYGAESITFVSSIGKLIKVAGGIFDTHSRNADARLEILVSHVLKYSDDIDSMRKILNSLTTEEGLLIIKDMGLLEEVSKSVVEKVYFYMRRRTAKKLDINLFMFSSKLGLLAKKEGSK